MALEENQIALSTNDPDLVTQLLEANIEGITVVNEYRKYSSDELYITLIITVVGPLVPFLAEKIWQYLSQNKSKKARINDRPIPDDLDETIIIFKQELKIQKRTTKKGERDPG